MRVLWLRAGPCLPLHHGGRVYSYHLISRLAGLCDVHVLESSDGESAMLSGGAAPYGQAVERVRSSQKMPEWSPKRFFTYLWPIVRNLVASREPLCLTLFNEAELRVRARELVARGQFDVVVVDGLYLAVMVEEWNLRQRTPIVLLQHNVESVIWQRVAQVQRNPVTWLFYHEMARRLRRREPQLCRLFEGVTAISPVDAAHLRQRYRLNNVRGVVPIGADLPAQEVPRSVVDLPWNPIITFVGSMNYQPNADAAFWFIRKILPVIQRTVPKARFRVIGRNPSMSLVREARRNPSVEISGTVPEVTPLLRESSVVVVPLRAGSGVRLKIMESLSAGVPVVSTRLGAEGLPLEDGKDLLLADDAAAFATAVLKLLQIDVLRRDLATRGLERARTDFTWQRSADALFDILKAVADR